jgi:hypothetical protein
MFKKEFNKIGKKKLKKNFLNNFLKFGGPTAKPLVLTACQT